MKIPDPETLKGVALRLYSVKPDRLDMILKTIMFAVFQAYTNSLDIEFVDTFPIATKILNKKYKWIGELAAAAYFLGAIEREIRTGENIDLLEELKDLAINVYHTTKINSAQFVKICHILSEKYSRAETIITK